MSEIQREILKSQISLLDDVPDNAEGREGQRTYRRVDGNINQYIKTDGEWVLLSTTAPPPPQDDSNVRRAIYSIIQSDSELTVNEHHDLSGLTDDDHSQYLLASGARALAGAWDMGNQNLTNVDIDGGTIDGTTVGVSSASSGAFTTLDVDNININGNTIATTDTNGNLVLSANGTGVIDIDDTLDVDGIAYLDDMKFDSNIIEVVAGNNLKLLPNGALLIDTYPATLSNNYAITNTADIYHFMSGQDDFKQNLSFLAIHNESTDFETYPAGR
jgi:hypothetical protein